jgi:tRNA-binding EMAP/Myf-like protein
MDTPEKPSTITIEEFAKIDFRIATIKAEPHPKSGSFVRAKN